MKNKLIATIILICMLTMTVSAGLLYPRPTRAQVPIFDTIVPRMPQPTIELVSIPTEKQSLIDKIWRYMKDALQVAGDIAYRNALKYFLQKVAYDTATYIATGDKGQSPLFYTETFGKYLQKTGDEAVGVFFEEITKPRKLKDGYCDTDPMVRCSKNSDCPEDVLGPGICTGATEWGGFGIDLCEPLEGQIKIDLTVAAKRAMEPVKPICTWNTIKKNLSDVRNMSLNDLVDFSAHFHPSSNDLGAYLTLRTEAEAYKLAQISSAEKARKEGQGMKPVTTPISGTIKSPSLFVAKMFDSSINSATEAEKLYTASPVANAISVFTNTLISKLLQRVFTKGFNPKAELGQQSDYWTLGGQAAARLFFGELAEVNYQFNVGMRLDEFVIAGNGQFNNIINDQFSRAIEQKCTVGQAIGYYKPGDDVYRAECVQGNIGLISGIAPFGYDQNGIEPNVNSGIPFRSILVLRKFRIVPVGWELAAEYYKNFDEREERLTLNKLVNDFTNSDSPYYKLVDPDWLLKMPSTRCAKEGAGPQKIEQEPYCSGQIAEGECEGEMIYPFQRIDYCADYESCLKEDSQGKCDINNWGYCIEEKSVWNIKGVECSKKYYASCQTMVNSETNQKVSYLLNTVSGFTDNVCDSSNSGCREYCEDYDLDENNWTCDFDSGNKKYLNSQSEDCGQKDEGCHLFYSSAAQDKDEVNSAFTAKDSDPNAYGLLNKNYVKLAPDYYGNKEYKGKTYLGCEGYTVPVSEQSDKTGCESAGYYWRDDIKRCVAGGSAQCANFVKHCQEKDASCNLYTPISTKSPAVPGVIEPKKCSDSDPFCEDETSAGIEWNDECPDVCVGYQTYHQMDTSFENGTDEDFIASSAKTCSQPGCDQFTNLDEVAKGGEGIEYYSYLRECIKPDSNDLSQQTYYTWEGSDTSGYQLKKWLLKAKSGDLSTPATVDDNYQECNLDNKDCREFFDKNLKSTKLYFSKTISVSDDCHPFRRTEDQEIYNAIPSQGIKCSASNNMCREYKSSSGYNYQKIIESYFANNSLGNWSGDGAISSESVRRGDYSLKVTGGVEYKLTSGDLEEGKIYTLEFLAKTSEGAQLVARFMGGQEIKSKTEVLINDNNWHHYSLKLPDNPQGVSAQEISNNKIEIRSGFGKEFFIDNIVLKKMNSLLLIKNSWDTPEICEIPSNSRTHLGCESYKSNKNNINLRSFTSLCFEDVAGCELVIDSKNTTNLGDDSKEYLVLDKKYKCAQNNLGCTRLGLVAPDRNDKKNYSFKDVYKINTNDSLQLCSQEEVFCQEYQDAQDENKFYYLKNPLDRTCEYKKVNNAYNWYQSGSEDLCVSSTNSNYYDEHCIGGARLSDGRCADLAKPGEQGLLSDWTALCESNSSGCREYQDPQEPDGCNKNLKNYDLTKSDDEKICNYYYYKDVETCNQGVNPGQGCVAFCETGEECDSVRSYKVCESVNGTPICNNDSDCGNGRCVYR